MFRRTLARTSSMEAFRALLVVAAAAIPGIACSSRIASDGSAGALEARAADASEAGTGPSEASGGAGSGGARGADHGGDSGGGARAPAPPDGEDGARPDASAHPPPTMGGFFGGFAGSPSDASVPSWCRPDAGAKDAGFLGALGPIRMDLESYCDVFPCPYRTLRAFLDAHACARTDGGWSTTGTPRLVGCGVDVVGGFSPFGGSSFTFDSATGKLVGAVIGSDAPFGPCSAASYYVGEPLPRTPCPGEAVYDCEPLSR